MDQGLLAAIGHNLTAPMPLFFALGILATLSVASCINNAGLIVGMSGLRGFLYSQGKMIDLLTLAPQESKWKMLTPRCINDRGQIAGTGVMADGLPHIFLMSPNP